MPTLHLVFVAPAAGSALADGLRAARPGDTVLLLQDGVYAAAAGAAGNDLLTAATGRQIRLAACTADVVARGLHGHLLPVVSPVDDDGFVALTESCSRTASWF